MQIQLSSEIAAEMLLKDLTAKKRLLEKKIKKIDDRVFAIMCAVWWRSRKKLSDYVIDATGVGQAVQELHE